jgi:hypothetical protein
MIISLKRIIFVLIINMSLWILIVSDNIKELDTLQLFFPWYIICLIPLIFICRFYLSILRSKNNAIISIYIYIVTIILLIILFFFGIKFVLTVISILKGEWEHVHVIKYFMLIPVVLSISGLILISKVKYFLFKK